MSETRSRTKIPLLAGIRIQGLRSLSPRQGRGVALGPAANAKAKSQHSSWAVGRRRGACLFGVQVGYHHRRCAPLLTLERPPQPHTVRSLFGSGAVLLVCLAAACGALAWQFVGFQTEKQRLAAGEATMERLTAAGLRFEKQAASQKVALDELRALLGTQTQQLASQRQTMATLQQKLDAAAGREGGKASGSESAGQAEAADKKDEKQKAEAQPEEKEERKSKKKSKKHKKKRGNK